MIGSLAVAEPREDSFAAAALIAVTVAANCREAESDRMGAAGAVITLGSAAVFDRATDALSARAVVTTTGALRGFDTMPDMVAGSGFAEIAGDIAALELAADTLYGFAITEPGPAGVMAAREGSADTASGAVIVSVSGVAGIVERADTASGLARVTASFALIAIECAGDILAASGAAVVSAGASIEDSCGEIVSGVGFVVPLGLTELPQAILHAPPITRALIVPAGVMNQSLRMPDLDVTTPRAVAVYGVDFAAALPGGATLTTASWEIVCANTIAGATPDNAPSSRLRGSVMVSGSIAAQRIADLVGGNDYRIVVTGRMSDGQVVEVSTHLSCREIH